jgi:hypothetical protein
MAILRKSFRTVPSYLPARCFCNQASYSIRNYAGSRSSETPHLGHFVAPGLM